MRLHLAELGAAGCGELDERAAGVRRVGDAAHEPALDALAWEAPAAPAVKPASERRKEAKLRGYEGEACPECANFTLVRNGTCLKCDTCGGTTGCS